MVLPFAKATPVVKTAAQQLATNVAKAVPP